MAEVKGMQAAISALSKLPATLEEAAERTILQTVAKTAADAKNLAPASKFSQALSGGAASIRGSITHKVEKEGGSVVGVVQCNAPHAGHVEFGTGPVGAANHAGISPHVSVSYTSREKWVYPYEGKEGTEFATTSGQPARPFLYPAAKQNERTFKTALKTAANAAIRGVGK